VDRALFDLCKFALRTTEEKTAVVFYRSPNIGDHLTLADKLLKLSLEGSQAENWRQVHSEVTRLLPFRNDIVHNPAIGTIVVGGFGVELPYHTHEIPPELEKLGPPLWAIKTEPTKLLHRSRSVEASREDLVEHVQAVNRLLFEMETLNRSLARKSPARRQAPRAR
jgi:hypothetical protein